jgi:hypothetical protein
MGEAVPGHGVRRLTVARTQSSCTPRRRGPARVAPWGAAGPAAYTLKGYGTGGSADNIDTTYTVNASSEAANGTWKLRVSDNARFDTGRIDAWALQF